MSARDAPLFDRAEVAHARALRRRVGRPGTPPRPWTRTFSELLGIRLYEFLLAGNRGPYRQPPSMHVWRGQRQTHNDCFRRPAGATAGMQVLSRRPPRPSDGLDAKGKFKTTPAARYPPDLCAAIANLFVERWVSVVADGGRAPTEVPVVPWRHHLFPTELIDKLRLKANSPSFPQQ